MLRASCWFLGIFDPEDGSDVFFRNVGWFSLFMCHVQLRSVKSINQVQLKPGFNVLISSDNAIQENNLGLFWEPHRRRWKYGVFKQLLHIVSSLCKGWNSDARHSWQHLCCCPKVPLVKSRAIVIINILEGSFLYHSHNLDAVKIVGNCLQVRISLLATIKNMRSICSHNCL